jgi:hypothetical protein
MNKKEEFQYSSFFLSQINLQNGSDYVAISNEDEAKNDQEVDVYATSEVFNNLKLQIKIIDKGYMPSMVFRQKEAYKNGEASHVDVRDLDPIKWVKQTIAECNRKYEPRVRSGMVLLLCLYHGGEMNQEFAKREFVEYRQADFNGIYLINPPRSILQSDPEYSGQVTEIKPLILKKKP